MRSVRLESPLADDLKAHRVASGNPPDKALILPRADGSAWTDTDYRNWRKRVFQKAARDAALAVTRPSDLRHTCASLPLHEGRSPVPVAEWMGHSLAVLSGTYAHVIEDVDSDDQRTAVDMLMDARPDKPMTSLRVIEGRKGSTRKPRARAVG